MRKLIKNRVNIFDKLAFGISFIPFLCFCTMFTYYFNDGLIVNSSDISSKGMYYVIKTLLLDFFSSISVFSIMTLLLLFGYQLYVVINIFITKSDKRRKKKSYDFGFFIFSCLLWVVSIILSSMLIIGVHNFEWLMVWFLGIVVEYQPLVIFIMFLLFISLINIFYNLRFILKKGMKKYLKECEKSDYKFTRGELLVGLIKIFIVLLFTVVVGNHMMMMLR